jgi:DNA modification methylase
MNESYLNKIVCGDCLELMKGVDDNSIDLVIADPPYRTTQYRTKEKWSKGVKDLSLRKRIAPFSAEWDRFTPEEYDDFTNNWISEVYRVLRQKGTAFIHCILTGEWSGMLEIVTACKKSGFILLNNISWCKPNGQPNLAGVRFSFSTEQILWVSKNGKGKRIFNYQTLKSINGGKQMRDYWIIPTEPSKFNHPSVKPLKLVERMVIGCSNEGGLVLDPFIGAGTTALVALKNNRRFIGFELNPEYCKIAEQRIRPWVLQERLEV